MRVLRARLLAERAAAAAEAEAQARRSQVRTVDRSERIRTYPFPAPVQQVHDRHVDELVHAHLHYGTGDEQFPQHVE